MMKKFPHALARFSLGILSVCIPVAGYVESFGYEPLNCFAADDVLHQIRHDASVAGTGLSPSMVDVALNINGDPGLQAKALAIAWVSGNESERSKVMEVDFYLRQGNFPKEDSRYIGIPSENRLQMAAIRTQQIVDGLVRGPGIETLEAMVSDVIGQLGVDLPERVSLFPPDQGKAEAVWAVIGKTGSSSSSIPAAPVVSSTPVDSTLIGRQSALHGLLVIQLEGSEFAGSASKMDLTVVAGSPRRQIIEEESEEQRGDESERLEPVVEQPPSPFGAIAFSQPVGSQMDASVREVQKFMTQRHGNIPAGVLFEISFEERNSIKDGASAALACALLSESVFSEVPLNRDFAVTGDMNADGYVQPVGGIDGKVRGAARGGCTHMAIPVENQSAISDLLILEGIKGASRIQVFTVEHFDEAWRLALASDQRDGAVTESLQLFNEVKQVLEKPGGETFIANPHVRERLGKVLELTPNHLSARLLLNASYGQVPQHLSLAGSFQTIDRCAKPLIEFGESKNFDASIEAVKGAVVDLKRIRNTLDPRTKGASDATEDLMDVLAELGSGGFSVGSAKYNSVVAEIDAALGRLRAEYSRLRNDPEVQEELNY